MTVPTFHNEGAAKPLADDDPLSSSPIKGVIKWNERDNCYALIWFQNPFRILFDNGGYSMTTSYLDDIPDHIDQVWVADDSTGVFRRFEKSQLLDGMDIGPGADMFTNVAPSPQRAVAVDDYKESYDLGDIQL